MEQTATVLVVGNPNSGKTSLFNALTGLKYKVANYPGVTVEKKTALLNLTKDLAIDCTVQLVDLPGIYSLSHNSEDERIATQAIIEASQSTAAVAILVVLDASNLERNLYLASQVVDLGLPTLFALNMVDLAESRGISIKDELLAANFGVNIERVVARSASANGVNALKLAIARVIQNNLKPKITFKWLTPQSPFANAASQMAQQVFGDQQPKNILQACLMLADSIPSVSKDAKAKDQHAMLLKQQSELVKASINYSTYEATERYKLINKIVRNCCVFENNSNKYLSDRIDLLVTDRLWGLVIFACAMGLMFQVLFSWAVWPMDLIDSAIVFASTNVASLLPEGILNSLITDGIISGVGSVLVFVPQIALLFFFLSLLDDSGYLARAAFLMDRVMRQFGLQGRSFIPLLSSFACAIPGILATRTIPSFSDRLATILVAPLMSCSARLPVYALLISAFVPSAYLFGIVSLQGLVLFAVYFLGIFSAVVMAWVLKCTILKGEPAVFVMEMPPFRIPSIKLALREAYDRVLIFIKSAGTIILACSVILWCLASFPKGEVRHSYAGQIGTAIEPLIKPLGYNWEIGVSLLASFAAREVFVSSLSTVYNLQQADDSNHSLISEIRTRRDAGQFPIAAGLSLIVFYVFACQCMSTLAVCRRETGSWCWTTFMFTYMTVLAYILALITYIVAGALIK